MNILKYLCIITEYLLMISVFCIVARFGLELWYMGAGEVAIIFFGLPLVFILKYAHMLPGIFIYDWQMVKVERQIERQIERQSSKLDPNLP